MMSGNSLPSFEGFNGGVDPLVRDAAAAQARTLDVAGPNARYVLYQMQMNMRRQSELRNTMSARPDTAPTQSYQEAQEAPVAQVDTPSTDPVTLAEQAVLAAYAEQTGQLLIEGL